MRRRIIGWRWRIAVGLVDEWREGAGPAATDLEVLQGQRLTFKAGRRAQSLAVSLDNCLGVTESNSTDTSTTPPYNRIHFSKLI